MRSLRQLQRLYQKQQLAQICRRQDFPSSTVVVDFPVAEKQSEQPTTFKKGDKAPFAYNDHYEYPQDYQPWNFNYKGNGILLASLFGLYFAYHQYEVSYLKRTGRVSRDTEKVYYKP